jgi:hypothetical protein
MLQKRYEGVTNRLHRCCECVTSTSYKCYKCVTNMSQMCCDCLPALDEGVGGGGSGRSVVGKASRGARSGHIPVMLSSNYSGFAKISLSVTVISQ